MHAVTIKELSAEVNRSAATVHAWAEDFLGFKITRDRQTFLNSDLADYVRKRSKNTVRIVRKGSALYGDTQEAQDAQIITLSVPLTFMSFCEMHGKTARQVLLFYAEQISTHAIEETRDLV